MYSKQQIIHSLSSAINSAFGVKCENYDTLLTFVRAVSTAVLKDTNIQALIGNDWEEVSQPYVYCYDKESREVHADNTIGVYYSQSLHLFVVAIAGTNAISVFDWIKEDVAVINMVDWKSITGKGKGKIAQGTATGLDILLHNIQPEGQPSVLDNIKNFIEQRSIQGAEIAVTGHSLGGALSPALALYMLNTQNTWDTSNSLKISAYPTAGPTIGNSNFTTYYESLISEQPTFGKIDYKAFYNPLDIVPHAWQVTPPQGKPILQAMFNIYEPHMKTPNAIKAACFAIILIISSKDYTQIKPLMELPGSKFNEHYTHFLGQAVVQHTDEYPKLLHTTDFIRYYQDIINQYKPAGVTLVDYANDVIQKATIDQSELDQMIAVYKNSRAFL
jgi:hypothetical protein